MFRLLIGQATRTSRRTRIIAVVAAVYSAVVVWAFIADHVVALVVFSIFGTALAIVASRARKARNVRKAKIKAAIGRTEWPERFGPWILDDECAEYEGRRHPIAILRWWVLCLSGPVAALLSLLATGNWIAFLILLLVPPLIASWKILDWWLEWRAITDIRVVEVKGILNIATPAVALIHIRGVTPVKPFFSRILERLGFTAYGHVVFETAAQVEAIPGLRYVRDVEAVNALLHRCLSSG